MKITKIETISLAEFPNVIWIQVYTDAGHVGLGETFFGSQAIHAYVHETLAPQMLGQDALRIEQHSRKLMQNYVGFKSTGAEIRGASAFDIALWDIMGQAAGMPLYQLLGGKCRDKIRVYNTCAGYRYVRAKANWGTNDWGLEKSEGPYEDLDAFLNRADDLAESLIAEGYTGMKIWPFDHAADKTGGNDISAADLKKGMEPFEKIRKRVGDKIDLHVEMHGLWNLPTAMKIARAMEPLEPYWFEDPIRPSNVDALKRFRESTRIWTTSSEMLSSRWSFREVFEKQATSVAMLDVGWCGGIGEAKKIATMAESYELPVAPHDCTGPVLLTASVHLSMASPNTLVQEVVRAFYFGWYKELVDELPPLANGFIAPTETPGLGIKLKPDLVKRADATIKVSALWTAASGKHLVLLAGAAVLPFRDGIAEAVATQWDMVAIPDDVSASAELIGRADAAIAVHYGKSWPAAPRLRLLQVPGAGYDGIALDAIPAGVTLCNVFEHEPGVSEYALLAMLEWCHRLGSADREMRAGNWKRSSRFGGAPDDELAGKTVVIVGLGRIGRAVARRAKAFDMRVLAVNRSAGKTDPNVDKVAGLDQLHDVFGEADFIVLACALTPETRGLIDAAALSAMKPSAVIVNPARGPVIDEAALYDALINRRIGGAAIDTWWDYPPTAAPRDPSTRHPFHQLDNVLLSPHVAGWTTGTLVRRTLEMAKNLDRLARGEPLHNVVTKE